MEEILASSLATNTILFTILMIKVMEMFSKGND